MRALPYLLVFLPAALTIAGLALRGPWTFLTVAFVFGVVPLLDLVIGRDTRNPAAEHGGKEPHPAAFRLVLWLYVPTQIALVLAGAWAAARLSLSAMELAGLVLSVGICTGGLGITIAHELIHKSNRIDRTLGQVLLLSVSYMHFYIEHLIGHHGHVATPEDPASARFGESFYAFYPRTVLGSWRSAWGIERQRLTRAGSSAWSVRNRMLWYVAGPAAVAIALSAGLGWQAAAFFAGQSVIAFSLLELVNYLEHYGLERRALASGRYEKVTITHSWSATHRLTNYFLVKLQRHADHHANAARPYQDLRHFDESPQLPTGYAGMVLLALVPPLWRKVMDPRVRALQTEPPAP